jgi:hypothetical protein
MKKQLLLFTLFFIGGTLFLLPNFYRNRWIVVEPKYYQEWQTRYDRLVIARLVKTRQDGFLSAGGLLGLGNVTEWNYNNATNKQQYNYYFEGRNFSSYVAYESNPGFQGFLYSFLDKTLYLINGEQKTKVFRGLTALASTMVFAIIFSTLTIEFGFLSGVSTLLFVAFSEWTILPAGSIFWDLWAFYLPVLASTYLLFDASRRGKYDSKRVYGVIFISTLVKILFSGLDLITTVLVMTSVPFIYFGIYDDWGRKLLLSRITKLGTVLFAATLSGVIILSIQITASAGSLASAGSHIFGKINQYTIISPENNSQNNLKAVDLNPFSIIQKELTAQAFEIHYRKQSLHISFWYLMIIFLLFTLIYLLMLNRTGNFQFSRKAIALIIATWYSLLAPLSWYIIFNGNSFSNPHIVPMAWQMPFTLLGFALCGFVVSDTFKRKAT